MLHAVFFFDTVMQDVRKVFEDRDTDKSGKIDMSEMSAAMKALNVKLSEEEIKSLFEVRTNKNPEINASG